jgi:polyhydroxybutyrate depolymerase
MNMQACTWNENMLPTKKRSEALHSTASLRLGLVCALAAAAVILTGCRNRGDDDDATATPTQTAFAVGSATQPAPAATESPAASLEPTPATTLPPFEAGTFERTITVDGREREYRLYVPNSLSGAPAPLVVGLHGGFGNAAQFARTARFDQQAAAGGFIAAYPQGLGVIPTWNGGRCCGFAAREDIDDVAFIEAMIDDIAAHHAIDSDQVYATGHSNGAIMSLRLACESDRFRAVAPVAGSLEISSCNPAHPVSILVIHGDADENHPLEGGRGDESISKVGFTSVADSMDILAPAMGCSLATDEQVDGPLTTTDWLGCPDGTVVRLIVVADASHAWPGGVRGIIFSAEPSPDLDATPAVWDFFSSLD